VGNLCQKPILGNSIIYTKIVAGNIASPDKASAWLIIQRSHSTMTDAKDVGVHLGAICNFGERGLAIVARKLEHVCWILNDVDVDISTFQRVHASSSIDRVLVLIHLEHSV
jgi:hypothetical protein